MDSNLGRGFYEVYNSSKEILKNNQTHLYCNMLDLLANTSKSTPSSVIGKILSVDELVRFWVEDILPLAFDDDSVVQGSAVSALEQGLLTLDISNIPNHSCWNNLKNVIVKEFASRVHQLREDRNQYWHRIWCILVRLLDREILKSASTINLFLSIVELGFRSPDNSVRAEAFTCWHLLIQIFANHNQLSSPKRLKLVCIPLKSSQSKTPYVAAVKLRIWWYLITCLGAQSEDNYENVVEPFLIFCFGSHSKSTLGIAQQYISVRELALTCLVAIVSKQRDEFIQRLLREYELEFMCQDTELITSSIVEKHWKSIFYAILEASNLLIESEKCSDIEQRLLIILTKSATRIMINNDMSVSYEYYCFGLIQMIAKNSRPVTIAANVIASEGLRLSRSILDFENYIKIIQFLVKFLTTGRDALLPNVIQQCAAKISNLEAFIPKQLCWRAVEIVAEYFINTPNDEGFEYFEVKFFIWRNISLEMVNLLRNNSFGRTAQEFVHSLISWSLWPLRMVIEFTGHRNNSIFDEQFYMLWHDLLQLSENTTARSQHLNEIAKVLNAILDSGYECEVFINLINAYADEMIKHDCNNYSTHFEQLFALLHKMFKKQITKREKEKLLKIFRSVLHSFKLPGSSSLIESIKCTLKEAINKSSKDGVDSKFYEEWKNSVINITRASLNKNFATQVLELFKDDVYVIIPSVWSLKPEKLTDRQKERITEKTNIPALYNDMSQSQDSLIKPWTPKKIVIAKEDQNEIVIEDPYIRQKQSTENNFFRVPNSSSDPRHQNIDSIFLAESSKKNKDFFEDLANSTTDKCIDRNIAEVMEKVNTSSPQQIEVNELDKKQVNEVGLEVLAIKNANPKVSNIINHESTSRAQSPKNLLGDTSKIQSGDAEQDHRMDAVEGIFTELTNPCYGADTIKEISPKKTLTKNSLLLSPPDRKLTNNNTSPKLRPKPPAHLTGRGAQLINMIRNRKIDVQSPQTPMPRLFVGKTDSIDRTVSDMEMVGVENTATSLNNKDILTFTKRLPSPSASPSTSILKRNIRRESLEDNTFESPAFKKKRVSFHDPPVSVTKEYIKHNDENKTKPKRCLNMDKLQPNVEKSMENKYSLKRRSKLDSIIEIEKFTIQQSNKSPGQPTNTGISTEEFDDDNVCGMDHSTEENETIIKFVPEFPSNSGHHKTSKGRSELAITNNLLEIVIEKHSFEEVLQKYFDCNKDSKLKCYDTIAKLISKGMSEDSKIKETILEALSENHSKDFLDHAIRENLASVVCDRLNLPSVIEYVCEKSKINTSCRTNIFSQLPDILKYCKQDAERLKVVQTILNCISLKDSDILDLMNVLLRVRQMNKPNSVTVSEAAIDSSSNL
ncbi:telomere-associated protein RIF1 [Bactrocera dorsalis]|uniref:Telomere-associated protein RIF1 n=2 Tax=Bactrocera dorsalis TaxID=27457 RepID=A0A6I9V3Y0_BACDO|nr:telomere-associated protein RIF1 [Bactrocera dorsalis]